MHSTHTDSPIHNEHHETSIKYPIPEDVEKTFKMTPEEFTKLVASKADNEKALKECMQGLEEGFIKSDKEVRLLSMYRDVYNDPNNLPNKNPLAFESDKFTIEDIGNLWNQLTDKNKIRTIDNPIAEKLLLYFYHFYSDKFRLLTYEQQYKDPEQFVIADDDDTETEDLRNEIDSAKDQALKAVMGLAFLLSERLHFDNSIHDSKEITNMPFGFSAN